MPPIEGKAADLALSGLTKTYGTAAAPVVAVDNVTLRVATGEMVALLGPSGCGKTTTLRMIAGLVEPTYGQVVIGGHDMTHTPVHRRNIGMLFQNYALFPHLTVAQNVAFGLEMRRLPRAETRRRVASALELVQLPHMAARLPAALSGGQQQRVALARALVIEPSVLLLDEPLGALDKGLRESMQVELRQLQRRLGITAVIVTHDQEEALTLADRIVIMRDGRLEQVGPPQEIYAKPNTRFVATFIGAANFLEPAGGGPATVLRPEAVHILPTPGPATATSRPATIDQVIYRGAVTHLHLRLEDGQPLLAYLQNRAGEQAPLLTPGHRIQATWSAADTHELPPPTPDHGRRTPDA